jgi:hypothetical protein
VQVRRRVSYGEDIAGRSKVGLEVVDFETLVEILRGFIFEDLEGNFLEELSLISWSALLRTSSVSGSLNWCQKRIGRTLGMKKRNER